jgi:transposase InsO family protein
MGIRDKPTAPASPWQNGFVERLIGSIRREWVDHIQPTDTEAVRRLLACIVKDGMGTGDIVLSAVAASHDRGVHDDSADRLVDFGNRRR